MNIIGIGMDATDLPRVADLLERYGERFLHRVFTDGEISYCTKRRDPVPHLAGRFAVKEAAMKALGTGQSRGVVWKDIEVVRGGRAAAFAAARRRGAPRRVDGRETVARDHHPFRDAGARAGPVDRRLTTPVARRPPEATGRDGCRGSRHRLWFPFRSSRSRPQAALRR